MRAVTLERAARDWRVCAWWRGKKGRVGGSREKRGVFVFEQGEAGCRADAQSLRRLGGGVGDGRALPGTRRKQRAARRRGGRSRPAGCEASKQGARLVHRGDRERGQTGEVNSARCGWASRGTRRLHGTTALVVLSRSGRRRRRGPFYSMAPTARGRAARLGTETGRWHHVAAAHARGALQRPHVALFGVHWGAKRRRVLP